MRVDPLKLKFYRYSARFELWPPFWSVLEQFIAAYSSNIHYYTDYPWKVLTDLRAIN